MIYVVVWSLGERSFLFDEAEDEFLMYIVCYVHTIAHFNVLAS